MNNKSFSYPSPSKINKEIKMADNPQLVPADLGLRLLQSFSAMKATLCYLNIQEQLQTQHICVWFYNYGTSRV